VKLYSYFRSSSSYRVRIGLHYKGVAFEYAPVHLLDGGGQQHAAWFAEVNAQKMVPVLEVDDNATVRRLTQSLAILEYLEETHPRPPLLPTGAFLRARTRQLAEVVNSSIQPLHNLAVLRKVSEELHGDRDAWAQHFIRRGLLAFEAVARESTGPYSICDHPTLADACLVPQLYQARRFGVDLSPYPTCLAIEAACLKLESFVAASPDRQPDAAP
jgi:maleylpyruvate isomerase